MKVQGLDGKQHTLDLRGKEVSNTFNKSSYHLRARIVLSNVFPSIRVVEEVHVPGSKNPLYLDFFLPLMKVAIEVQGEQHYKFSSHFHKDKLGFGRSKTRDSLKKQWCDLNGFYLVELPYNETDEQWEERLRNVFGS